MAKTKGKIKKPSQADIEKFGFRRPLREMDDVAVIGICGKPDSGKTTFGLSAPRPVGHFNFDRNLKGIEQKVKDDPDVWFIDIPAGVNFSIKADEELYKEAWDKFYGAYHYALRHMRSIIWDTGSEVYELVRLFLYGRLEKVLPRYYGEVNKWMARLFEDAKDAGVNLITIHRLKQVYVNDKFSGKYDLEGWKTTRHKVDVLLECWCEEDDPLGFNATILRCTPNRPLVGEELSGDFLNYEALMNMVLDIEDA